MKSSLTSSHRVAVLVCAVGVPCAVVVAGCSEEKKAPTKPAASAEKEVVDSKVTKAFASAKPAKSAEGPPETGVFSPGAADKIMQPGVIKVELGSDGEEPRVTLKPAPYKGNLTLRVSVRFGRAVLPNVDLGFALALEKKKDGEADAAQLLLADLKKPELSREQPGQLPAEAGKEIAKLKGSAVAFELSPLGVGMKPRTRPAKDAAGTEISLILDAAADALFYAQVPPPPKPVGVGAFWVAGSRQILSGTEVIAYRLYKVHKVEGDKVTLTLESHNYSVGGDFLSPPGAPKGAPAQFQANAAGELVLRAADGIAESMDLQTQWVALFGTDLQNAKSMQVQTQTRLTR